MLNKLKIAFILALTITVAGCGSKTKPNDTAAQTDTTKTAAASSTKTILVFGDSLTAGYGLDDQSESYPSVLQNQDRLG